MTAPDFILGYTLPMMVMTIAQATITLLVAGAFGLEMNINIIFAVIITALIFVGTGLFFGSILMIKPLAVFAVPCSPTLQDSYPEYLFRSI